MGFNKICPRCRHEFIQNRPHQIYCSSDCKCRRSDIICNCVTCNKEFKTGHKRKYCSNECNPHIRIWDKSKRKCPTCHKIFIPKRHIQKYCSRACNPYKMHSKNEYYQTKEWKEIRIKFLSIESNRVCSKCNRPTFA